MASVFYNGKEVEVDDTIVTELDYYIPRIAKFEKVSFEQFKKDMISQHYNYTDEYMKELYDNIKLPVRATKHSAGYDFFTPFSFTIRRDGSNVIPTGIKCDIKPGWVLKLYPRSGFGNKFGMFLYDTVAVIDGDYYNNIENEGHILIKLSIREGIYEKIQQGIGICQGVFEQYGITEDDNATGVRTGGFGSTSKK